MRRRVAIDDVLRRPKEVALEAEFLKNWVQQIRDLAEKADPFIKRRLLDLAQKYEQRAELLGSKKRIRTIPPINYPAASRDEKG